MQACARVCLEAACPGFNASAALPPLTLGETHTEAGGMSRPLRGKMKINVVRQGGIAGANSGAAPRLRRPGFGGRSRVRVHRVN